MRRNLLHEPETELGHVGDQNERNKEDEDERQRGGGDLTDGLLEPETRHEQVKSHRRHQVRDLQIRQEDDAEMDRVDAVLLRHRDDERNDDDGGEDLHHHADDEQEDVQDDQEEDLARYHLADILEQFLRHLLVDQIARESHRAAEDHQDRTHKHHTLLHHPRHIGHQFQVLVDEHFHHEHIERRDRCGFGRRKETAIDTADDEERQRDLPRNGFNGRPRFFGIERVARNMRLPALLYAVDGHNEHENDTRDDAGFEERIDRDLGERAVEDNGERRRKEQSQTAGGGDQTERELLRIFFRQQDRENEPSERHDGHARTAGERGEDRAADEHNDGESTRHPADERLRKSDNAQRRLTFRKEVSGHGEERDGEQNRLTGKAVEFDDDGGSIDPLCGESVQRYGADNGEERRAEEHQREQSESDVNDRH